jgi:transposase, IS5 family
MVKLQEAENQIVIDYEVYDKRPNDADLLVPAIEIHQATLGRPPHLVAAAAAFYSNKNEKTAKARGVKRVCVPNRSTKSAERKREQKRRWFRNGQKWRTGCEGRISVAKRRHGLNRCRYKRDDGMKRWVGFGVIADNLISIGGAVAKRNAKESRQHRASTQQTKRVTSSSINFKTTPLVVPAGFFCFAAAPPCAEIAIFAPESS